jgi:hypothetical protein
MNFIEARLNQAQAVYVHHGGTLNPACNKHVDRAATLTFQITTSNSSFSTNHVWIQEISSTLRHGH